MQGKLPSPVFPIVVENVKLDMHGMAVTLVPMIEREKEIFNIYGQTFTNALTSEEVDKLISDKREPHDYSGWILAAFEWKLLHLFAKNGDGLLTKERVKGVYDGSLFDQLAKDHASKIKA
nr:probable peroxygenase 5 isoform X1 [Ipomoea batatas]